MMVAVDSGAGVEAEQAFAEAARALGMRVTVASGSVDARVDVNGRLVDVELKRLSSVTPSGLSQLLASVKDRANTNSSVLRVLVADRIVESARHVLRTHGWGWLDLRGHLYLSGPGVLVDAKVPPFHLRTQRASAFSGRAGLEVACVVLMEPEKTPTVRGLARELSRSPSTVSEVLNALRRDGLIRRDGSPLLPELFWETAEAWQPNTLWLSSAPDGLDRHAESALQLGLDRVESTTGWALTDTLAAVAYGAPVGMRRDHPPDFYVPSDTVVRRAVHLLGQAAEPSARKASIRVAPVPMVCARRVDPTVSLGAAWPLAHPLFVALDLAKDPDRGRQVLEDWRPGPPWHRVW